MLEISEIFNAAAVLKDVARKTAIIPAPKLRVGTDIYLKTENLQLTGSFKTPRRLLQNLAAYRRGEGSRCDSVLGR